MAAGATWAGLEVHWEGQHTQPLECKQTLGARPMEGESIRSTLLLLGNWDWVGYQRGELCSAGVLAVQHRQVFEVGTRAGEADPQLSDLSKRRDRRFSGLGPARSSK